MERIKLNLIPSGVAPIVHLSQYDDGRKFGIDLFEGESVYVLDGTETLTVNSRKPDGHVVVIVVTNTGTSSLDVDTVEQLTAVHGVSYAKLQIVKGSVTIATLPFLIDVSRDPLENGDPSESFIQNLRTQIANGVAEEVATQYDSANVIFDNTPTSGHGTPYTVTSEGIKTAIDNAFDYDNTASGSIVHITDGADNVPVKSLSSEIVAVQSGSGTPSPSNPRAISGFANGIIGVYGTKNLFGGSLDGTLFPTKVLSGTQLTASMKSNSGASFRLNLYRANQTLIDFWGVSESTGYQRTFTATEDIYYFAITNVNGTVEEVQIEKSSSKTTYEAYNGNNYTFAFGQTVYGGRLIYENEQWSIEATHTGQTFTSVISGGASGTTSWWAQLLSSGAKKAPNNNTKMDVIATYLDTATASQVINSENDIIGVNTNGAINIKIQGMTSVADYNTYLSNNPLLVVYELETPIIIPITSSTRVKTISGENNIYSNTGDVEVNYYTSKSNDILEFIDSEIGKKNGTNIPIEENSQDSIKDYVDNGLSGKADTTDTYTKNEVDTLLSGKAGTTEDTTITVASGFTLVSSSCGKTDRLVHLNFNVEKTGGFVTGWQAIGTTTYKPNTLVYCPLWNVTNGVGNGEVRIDTDGTINFYVVTAGELRLNANIGYITD